MTSAFASPQSMAAALRNGTYMTPVRDRPEEAFDRRTFAHVRKNSLVRGGAWEAPWIAPMPEEEVDGIQRAVRALVRRMKDEAAAARGRRGPTPWVAIEIVKIMGWFFKKTGRFEMTIEEIAERVGCSISAVYANLKRLRDQFQCVVWQRRCVPTGAIGQRGPQYEQTSNLYRLVQLPKTVMDMILRKQPPRPDDELARQAQRQAQAADLEAQAAAIAQKAQEDRSPAIAAAAARAWREGRGESASPIARVARELGLAPPAPSAGASEPDNPPDRPLSRTD